MVIGVGLLTLLMLLLAGDNQLDNTLLEKITHGNWWDGIMGVWSIIGEYVIVILFLLGPTLLAVKQRNIVPAAFAVMILGIPFAALFTSPIRFFFAVAAIFGFAIVLYGVTRKQ